MDARNRKKRKGLTWKQLQESAWDSRHHVLASGTNAELCYVQRRFFDNAPGVRVRGGVYFDTNYSPSPAEMEKWKARAIRRQYPRALTSLQCTTSTPGGKGSRSLPAPEAERRPWTVDGSGRHVRAFPGAPLLQEGDRPATTEGRDREGISASPPERPRALVKTEDLFRALGLDMKASTVPSPSDARRKFSKRRSRTVSKQACQDHVAKLVEFAIAVGQKPYQDFLEWVQRQFGDMATCWKKLDKDESLALSRVEFTRDLRALGYSTKTKELDELWHCLDRDNTGNVSFLHVDPPTCIALIAVKTWCDVTFGGVCQAATAFDVDHSGSISFEELEAGCHKRGFPEDRYPKAFIWLFHFLCHSSRSAPVPIPSLGFLDRWHAPEYFTAEVDAAGADTLREIVLRRHKGNSIRAWRKSLDQDSSMRVCWLEFKKLITQLRDRHPTDMGHINIAGVWRYFDRGLSGWLTLGDFDSEGFRVLEAFVRWCHTEHGSVPKAFKAMVHGHSGTGAHAGLGRGRLHKLLSAPLDFGEDELDLLFDGLNLEDGDRIQLDELKFLEHWNGADEKQEREAWSRFWGPPELQNESERDAAAD